MNFTLLTTGKHLQNRYCINRPLGAGGMGAVYEAFDERLKKTVALKQVLTEHSRDKNLSAAFEREAQLLANFEMTKIPNAPTVSGSQLQELEHFAPELKISPATVDCRADVYSWASIFFQIITGSLYRSSEHKKQILSMTNLPEKWRQTLLLCLAETPLERPSDILKTLERADRF
ncbi:MAG: hypothetical protein ACR2N3_05440 [Pyrinomonadaceae bacterium]